MKNIIILILILGYSSCFSQTIKKQDTSEICMPYNVAQKILLDLNDYDKLKELSVTDKKEIYQLNTKITFLEKTNETWVEKDSLNNVVISEINKKYNIIQNQNDELRKEVKKLKVKNTIIEIIGGALLTTISIFSIVK